MIKTKISQTPGSFMGGGVNPYESPSCEAIRINVSGPLCQSLDTLANPVIDFEDELNLGLGGDL